MDDFPFACIEDEESEEEVIPELYWTPPPEGFF